MLTMSDSFKRSARGGRPIFVVTITLNDSSTHRFISGHSTVFADPIAIQKITPVHRYFDPFERMIKINETTVTFGLDSMTKDLVLNNRLKGQDLNIKLGFRDTSFVDLMPYFSGVMDMPDIDRVNGTMSIKVREISKLGADAVISGYWIGMHPLEVIADMLDKLGIPSSYINSASFDPANFTDISHLCFSLGYPYVTGGGEAISIAIPMANGQIKYIPNGYSAVTGVFQGPAMPFKPLPYINLMTRELNGLIFAQENGKLTFSRFDSSTAIVRTLTDDDILDLRIVDPGTQVYNRAVIQSHWWCEQYIQVYIQQDTDAQDAYRHPGATSLIASASGVAHGVQFAQLSGSISGVDTTINLHNACHEFSGTRWPGFPSGSQPADAVLSGARKAYLKIDAEIIECDACTPNPNMVLQVNVVDPDTGSVVYTKTPGEISYSVSARGARGTAAASHASNATVFDITANVLFGDEIVDRWRYGVPILEVDLNLEHIDLQIGDLIGMVTQRYLAYGNDGLTAATKFEIIGKLSPVGSDKTMTTLTVAFAYDASTPAAVLGPISIVPILGFDDRTSYMGIIASSVDLENHVVSGLTVSAVAGLGGKVVAGSAIGAGSRFTQLATDNAFTFPANKDTYVYFSMFSAAPIFKSVANGDPEPVQPPGSLILGKVVTGGAAISSVENRQQTGAMTTNKLTTNSFEILADNAGFEFGNVGWDVIAGSWRIGASTPRSGSFAANCTAAASELRNKQRIKVEPSDVFYAECWAKLASGTSGGFKVRIAWFDGDGATLSNTDSTEITGSTTYQQATLRATAPANAKYASVSLVRSTAGAQLMYFDDVRIEHSKNSNLVNDDAVSYQHLDLPAQFGSGSLFNTNVQKRK